MDIKCKEDRKIARNVCNNLVDFYMCDIAKDFPSCSTSKLSIEENSESLRVKCEINDNQINNLENGSNISQSKEKKYSQVQSKENNSQQTNSARKSTKDKIDKGKKVNSKDKSFKKAIKCWKSTKEININSSTVKLISPPEQDPTIKKNRKRSKKIADNLKLGGIFTINNGWDKDVNVGIKKKESIPKTERCITPPMIVTGNIIQSDDVMEAHNEFRYNEDFMKKFEASPVSSTPGENGTRTLSHLENDIKEKYHQKCKSSVNSSEDTTEDGYSSENFEDMKHRKKMRKLAYSNEKVVEPSVNHKRLNDDLDQDDVLSICADLSDLCDSDEFNDDLEKPELCTEADDLKIIAFKQDIQPLDPVKEFEMNTKIISQHMVDPETDRILKTVYGDACPAFLDKRCTKPKCRKAHVLLSEEVLRPRIINAPIAVLDGAFKVALRFHRLFQTYVSIFTEICIKNKSEVGLAELVKACDRYPRTICCYKEIVSKLVDTGFMKQHQAISFIIQHHTDSEIARDTILNLIIDSGPCLAYFTDYIEKVHMLQTIRSDVFNRILHICVAYQNPKLPNFCLNYLQTCPVPQMSVINPGHLITFMQMNRYLIDVNENRVFKSMIIAQKLKQ